MTRHAGYHFIGGTRRAEGSAFVHSYDATTGEKLSYDFYQATPAEADLTVHPALNAR